jgi:NADH-quinone oxidoreductase subunit D
MGGALGGGATVFLYCIREREWVLDLFEALVGARLLYGFHQVGGTRYDIPAGWAQKCRETITLIEKRLDEYEDMLERNAFFQARTQGVGTVSRELAQTIGFSGPLIRGSGVSYDIRRLEPYSSYEDFDFKVPVETAGDCYARYRVRMVEFRESISIVRQALDGLPEGPIIGKVPRLIKPPAGETYHAIESPKGELGYFIASDGKSNTPYRFRVRPPSFCNLQALPRLIKGHLVADVVALIGSIDIVLGEVDR